MNINIKLVNESAKVPTYGSNYAAGADLYACVPQNVTVMPSCSVVIPTGIAVEIPEGYAGFIFARSGLSCKGDLAPANKVGVIDSDYRGEVAVVLHNHGKLARVIKPGDRVAQLVILSVEQPVYTQADELGTSDRGAGGFGSTGI